jgi:hypothetical protein
MYPHANAQGAQHTVCWPAIATLPVGAGGGGCVHDACTVATYFVERYVALPALLRSHTPSAVRGSAVPEQSELVY